MDLSNKITSTDLVHGKDTEIDLTNKDYLIQHLKQHGLWAKKSLGQNFLVDKEVLDKIIEAAELSKNDTVLEIGPGAGALTEELVNNAGKVIAIEKDERLAGALELRIKNSELSDNIEIVVGDALDFDTKKPMPNAYKLVANIPYYITSKILEKYLSAENKPEMIVLLVQKEVAERICAKPGNLSLLAISVQYYGEPEIVDIVPKESFFPVPEVDSAIIKIRIKNKELRIKQDEKEFFKVVKAGFRARRKTLFNNLKSGISLNSGQIEGLLDKMNISRNARAQELTIKQWSGLVREIKNS